MQINSIEQANKIAIELAKFVRAQVDLAVIDAPKVEDVEEWRLETNEPGFVREAILTVATAGDVREAVRGVDLRDVGTWDVERAIWERTFDFWAGATPHQVRTAVKTANAYTSG